MIVPGPATRIFLAPGPTDLRRSFDGLHGLVRSQLAACRTKTVLTQNDPF